MSGYTTNAYTYDIDNLPFDKEGNRYKPNKKELELFKKKKADMYKGTWMICFIYGLSALGLLGTILFTDWGREYVYNKFLPAVVTYLLGAIIIIVYLIFSIFALVPEKINVSLNKMPVCPDYWHLESTESDVLSDMHSNLPNVDNTINKNNLKIRCVPDDNVYGDTKTQYNASINLYNKEDTSMHMKLGLKKSAWNDAVPANADSIGTQCSGNSSTNEECEKIFADPSAFLYKERNSLNKYEDYNGKPLTGNDTNKELKKYAQIIGNYNTKDKSNQFLQSTGSTNVNVFNSSLTRTGNDDYLKYPLICNQVYPKLLDSMEPEDKDHLKCNLAKICGMSWSKLDCYSSADDINTNTGV